MDDLLKELRADTPAMDSAAETAARARLLHASTTAHQSPRLRFGFRSEVPSDVRRRRRARRLVLGPIAATAVVTALLLGLNAAGPEPVREDAAAAMIIERVGDEWKVSINDAYADPGEFKRAFAKMGLNVELVLAPVSPGFERRVFRMGSSGDIPKGSRFSFDVSDCPRGVAGCPLTMTIGGNAEHGSHYVLLGRKAKPGEPYQDPRPGPKIEEPVDGLCLVGMTVKEAEAVLKARGLGVRFALGQFTMPGGAGSMTETKPDWRPNNIDQPVDNAWMYSSDAVTLLVSEN